MAREYGTARTFVDELDGGAGDDQPVALAARLLQMTNVTHVQQVEHAMAEHDVFAGGALGGGDVGKLLERPHLAVRRRVRLAVRRRQDLV